MNAVFSHPELPADRLTPERISFTPSRTFGLSRSFLVSTSGLPASAYKNPIYADAPLLLCVAEVIMKRNSPARIFPAISATFTGFPIQPNARALLKDTLNVTGVIITESTFFTQCCVSPMVIQIELAGHTASNLSFWQVFSCCIMSIEPL